MISRATTLHVTSTIATGFAIFSMFFGSGNLLFPIQLGQRAGGHLVYSYLGLLVTGVLFTLIGLLAIILYRGDYHLFFNRLGKIPGTILNIFVLVMIGPLTGLPRAINVLHQVAHPFIPTTSLFNFILIFLTLMFFACHKRERIMPLLGYVISPVLVTLLFVLIGYAWHTTSHACAHMTSSYASFTRGIHEGYATMDLMAAFHFAPLAITYLQRMSLRTHIGFQRVLRAGMAASIITACLLASIYAGLTYIGAHYCTVVDTRNPVTLAFSITAQLLPERTMIGFHTLFMLAIISTAISLITIFTDFLHEDLFDKKVPYSQALLITLVLSGCAANGGLHAILRFEKPFLDIFYPPLIILTLCNIAYKAFGFKPVKRPVAIAFLATLIHYLVF